MVLSCFLPLLNLRSAPADWPAHPHRRIAYHRSPNTAASQIPRHPRRRPRRRSPPQPSPNNSAASLAAIPTPRHPVPLPSSITPPKRTCHCAQRCLLAILCLCSQHPGVEPCADPSSSVNQAHSRWYESTAFVGTTTHRQRRCFKSL